jgi:hypothetical protein
MPTFFDRKGRLAELFGPERLPGSLLSSRFEKQFEMVAGPRNQAFDMMSKNQPASGGLFHVSQGCRAPYCRS